MTEHIINSQASMDAYIEHLKGQWEKHHYLRVSAKTGKQRSLTQNRALHLYLQMVSEALNDRGLDFRVVVKDGVDVPWTPELTKTYIWRPVQVAVTGAKSTTEPEAKDYTKIYESINRLISSKFGIYVPWPSIDSKQENQ